MTTPLEFADFCGPRTVAEIAGIAPLDAAALIAMSERERGHEPDGRSSRVLDIGLALEACGFNVLLHVVEQGEWTAGRWARAHREGVWCVAVRDRQLDMGHVMPLRWGKLIDRHAARYAAAPLVTALEVRG